MTRQRLIILLCSIILLLPCERLGAQYATDEFLLRARRALSEGKYASSIENLNILIKLDSTGYWPYFFRGIAKYNLGDVRGAYYDFDKSVQNNMVFTAGYHYRAITLSRFGHFEEALRDFQMAIDLRPGDETIYYSRGVTFFLAQDFDDAVKDFNRYIRKQPKDASAYLNRGASLLFLRDTLKALSDYNKAIEIDHFDAEAYIRRSRLYASIEDYEEAIADLDQAIALDPQNSFAFFNRALLRFDRGEYKGALSDMNTVLKMDPGNALTLYNRSLIYIRVGDYQSALSDIDRVININPGNVLAYFNRAAIYIELKRYKDALADYNKCISLYPDFAKAYMNRAYVENLLGMKDKSQQDYKTAQTKIKQYREAAGSDPSSFADTTKKYSSLLAFDADFAKHDFNDELLQNRDIDVKLQPLYRFTISNGITHTGAYALSSRYENALMENFISSLGGLVALAQKDSMQVALSSQPRVSGSDACQKAASEFLKALGDNSEKKYSKALAHLDNAVEQSKADEGRVSKYYRAFYLMNRSALKADMAVFLASMGNAVQTLSLDNSYGTTAKVSSNNVTYDYSEALQDILAAAALVPDNPYILFDLAGLYILTGDNVSAIKYYNKALQLYPAMASAYFNRGLVLVYLKDKEKGCSDLSRAGELGLKDAYSIIKKYCEDR